MRPPCSSWTDSPSTSSVAYVRRDGLEVKLSPKEYDLLRLFVIHAGKVLTHAFILRAIWGPTTDPQQLRVYVRQLRQKIERVPSSLASCSPRPASATACGHRNDLPVVVQRVNSNFVELDPSLALAFVWRSLYRARSR